MEFVKTNIGLKNNKLLTNIIKQSYNFNNIVVR